MIAVCKVSAHLLAGGSTVTALMVVPTVVQAVVTGVGLGHGISGVGCPPAAPDAER